MWDSAGRTFIDLTFEPLSVDTISSLVSTPKAGATSVFVGATRNNFNGKEVTKLEYEGYKPMAEKCMRDICEQACEKWDLCKVAAVHRLGTVLVQEASIVIAASSAHRKAAIEACHWIIDEVKVQVPVWKKEFFTDGSVWKENAESRKR